MMDLKYDSWEFITGVVLMAWTIFEVFKGRTVEFISFLYAFDPRRTPIRYYLLIIFKIGLSIYLIRASQIDPLYGYTPLVFW